MSLKHRLPLPRQNRAVCPAADALHPLLQEALEVVPVRGWLEPAEPGEEAVRRRFYPEEDHPLA